jgi:hypothetical protein
MRSLFRTIFLGLICLLLIASSDAADNVYSHRSWRSLAAAQSNSVITVNPGAYQTPDPGQGGLAVSDPSNGGHGNTNVHSSAISDASHNSASDSQTKTCLWPAFQNVSAPKVRVTLKFNWAQSGSFELDAPENLYRASASSTLRIDYSTNNGGSWTNQVNISHSRLVRDGNSDYVPISDSGSVSVDLPNPAAIDITQIRVRDNIATSVNTFSPIRDFDPTTGSTAVTDVTMSIWSIQLEVEFVNCITGVPADRWKGEYFNNQTLSDSPAMVRDDSIPGSDFLNLNFGSGSPHSLCFPRVDNFSARWTRIVNLAQGIYRFSAAVDNGARLYVDGYLRIDQWANSPPNTYTADVFLDAGSHEIKLEFIEYTDGASVSLSWTTVSGANCIASVPADRWKGEYYSNTNLAGSPAMARNDGVGFLNFNFGGGGPGSGCGLGEDYFSARWTRTINFGSGVYRFSVTADDGVRLYVDGNLIIDKWFSQAATTYTADMPLSAGPHQVKLEYFESSGPAIALLSWADLTGVNCLPNTPLPLISSVPQSGGGENIASTAPAQTPKRCGQKNSD